MKKTISFLLVLLMLWSTLSICVSAADSVYATIVAASDFQSSFENANERFGNILNVAKSDGITVNAAVFGGDYSTSSGIAPGNKIKTVKETISKVYPNVGNNTLFVQGNHDLDSAELMPTGLYDFTSFLVYSMNEDEYYRPQGGSSYVYGQNGIQLVAENLKASLKQLTDKGEKRPVIIITHAPLHHSTRSGYCDTLYSKYVFDEINNAAKKLDILFLFGHNHSSDYDDYIGGSVNYLKKGETLRIPVPSYESAGEKSYTNEKLNFTYMNCGYVGYSKNGTSGASTNKLTASFIQLGQNTITVKRYSTNGLYSTESIKKINQTSSAKTSLKNSPKNQLCIADTYSSGVTQLKAGHHYIIGRELTEKEGFVSSAAKAEEKITAKKTYLSLKDREIFATYSAGLYTVSTSDATIVYVAEEMNGNIYLKNEGNGMYLCTKKTGADSVYTSGKTDVTLVPGMMLDADAVCSYKDGALKIGSYYLKHSSSCYFYASSSSSALTLFEGKLTEENPVSPDKPDKTCGHICHNDGFLGLIWDLIVPVLMLFGLSKTCSCGAKHY